MMNKDHKPTVVDEGWRSDNNGKNTNPPASDPSGKNTTTRKSTQVDSGWRNTASQDKAPVRKSTQVDDGWRNAASQDNAPARKSTQVDDGWRNAASQDNAPARKSTQVDDGWRNAAQPKDTTDIMESANANAFRSITEFQEAVAGITVLTSSTGDQYPVQKVLSNAGGESVILLCKNPAGKDVVAKLYFDPINSAGHSIKARSKVLEYMKTEEGKEYTLAVIAIGLAELSGSRYYFEIMPYCPEGDLSQAEPFSFEELVALTRRLNEALHSMHKANILHRDIKPANLYRCNGSIVIGDFGVAKIADGGATTVRAFSEGYCAPEYLMAINSQNAVFFYDEKCDYYSLGVTLGSLFEGHFVYENLGAAMMTQAVRDGKLPLVRTDPHRDQLENLLNGLCRFDARYRFDYDDVNKWLIDHNYTGGVAGDEWQHPFRMLRDEYTDEKSLFFGVSKDNEHWEEGKAMLYDKYFENFFRPFRTDLARAAQKADETYRNSDPDKGLAMFLKALYAPGPIVWKGYTFYSLHELSQKMAVTSTPAAYSELLQKKCISHWLDYTEGIKVDAETRALVQEIEELSAKEPEVACYWFGNAFSTEKQCTLFERKITDVKELVDLLFSSPADSIRGDWFNLLSDRKACASLYGFLYSLGYRETVDLYWQQLRTSETYHKVCQLFAMFDTIAGKAGVNPAPIRRFFVTYGPLGIATYIQSLVSRPKNAVYKPLDTAGRQVLDRIRNFHLPASGTIDELLHASRPLTEDIQKLKSMLMDNPFCVITGVYEDKSILCVNLVGCFAYGIYGQAAPLGFSAWIESANGGTRK